MASFRPSRARLRARLLLLLVSICTVAGFVIPPEANAALLPSVLPKKPLNPLMVAVDNVLVSVNELLAQVPQVQTQLEATAAAMQADVDEIIANGQADPATILPAVQELAAGGGALGGVQSQALSLALSLASKVAKPICPVLGAVAAETSGLSVPTMPDYSLFGPLAPVVKQTDRDAAAQVRQIYVDAFAKLLSPVALPAPADAANPYITLAQALLTLLKVNWKTTYYPADGGAPQVVNTPGFMYLPSLIDVDGNLGFDLCANFAIDLASGGMNQQIDRIPLADPKMRADVSAEFLGGVIAPGYAIPAGSFVPSMFETVHKAIATNFSSKVQIPGPTFAQTFNLTSAIQLRTETTRTPEEYSIVSQSAAAANNNTTLLKYRASGTATQFAQKTIAGTIQLATGTSNPAPARFDYCTATSGGCSNEPGALPSSASASMYMTASKETDVSQTISLLPPGASGCAALAAGDAHFRGQEIFLAQKTPVASTNTPGKVWMDTNDLPVTGCLATASTTAQLKPGFKAQDRLVTIAPAAPAGSPSGTPPPATSKSGTITCPTGTTITGGSSGLTFGLSRYLCVAAPVNTAVPVLTGQSYQASELTTSNGTWTPPAPNAPSFTYKWQRCGTSCVDIAGATTNKYTLTPADLGSTIRSVVTATNLDGTASATSAPTAVVTLPPAPANTAPPVITGTLGSGHPLTASKGTWINAPVTFDYEWSACDVGGANCAVVGSNSNSYTPSAADEGRQIIVKVTAGNIGGSASATSDPAKIPAKPVAGSPTINNGSTLATGQNVFQDDTLTANTGTWTDATSFSYQWLRCDSTGANCASIDDAEESTYKTVQADVNSTISVRVTGHNANQAPNNETSAEAPVTGLVLANDLIAKPSNYVPDGKVYASAPSDRNTSFIGGVFDTIGKIAGKGGAVAIGAPANADGTYPTSLDAHAKGGVIKASIPDGSGGFFIGGTFTSVQDVACPGFAHLTASGVDPAYCHIGGLADGADVRAISQMAQNATAANNSKAIGVGGLFTAADGHKNFFVIDPTQATPLALFSDADPNDAVNTVTNNSGASSNNFTFYIGGVFTAVQTAGGPESRGGMVAYTTTSNPASTVTKTTWTGGICNNSVSAGPCTSPGEVRVMVWTSLGVLTGGKFNAAYMSANPTTTTNRNNVADISGGTGGVLGWNPNANSAVNAITGASNFGSNAANGSSGPYSIFIGGEFTTLGGGVYNYPYLAEWGITALAGNPAFSGCSAATAALCAAAAQNNAAPSSTFVPSPNGPVTALVSAAPTPCAPTPCGPQTGLYVAGNFTSILGQPRHRVALISPRRWNETTALTLDAWAPKAGNSVNTISRDATNVFIGGSFNVLAGAIRNNVAEISPNGDLAAWAPAGTNGPVNALLVKDGKVIAGGLFTKSGADLRGNLVAFDATSAATDAWNPGATGGLGGVSALASSPNGVYVGGEFNTAGSQTRNNFAEIDNAGVATSLDPSPNGGVNSIAVSGGVVYLGGSFTAVGAESRSRLAAINQSDGLLAAWAPSADNTVYVVKVAPSGIYVGGGLTGGIIRVGTDGTVDGSYNPTADGIVRTIEVVGNRAFIGGEFLNVGSQPRSRAAQLELDGTPTGSFKPEPNGSVYAITYSATNVLGVFGDFDTISSAPTLGYGFYGA